MPLTCICFVLFCLCLVISDSPSFCFCLFIYYIFIFFSFNIFHRSRLCGFPGLWHDFCVQICPNACISFWINIWLWFEFMTKPTYPWWYFLGAWWLCFVFCFILGVAWPHCTFDLLWRPLQISALCTTSTPLATAILWVAAPPSLPCSPPSSCLDYFLLSQASPLHRDRLRSHDDGGMHSCGRSLFKLTKGAKASIFFSQSFFHLDLRVQERAGSQHIRYLNTSRGFLFCKHQLAKQKSILPSLRAWIQL